MFKYDINSMYPSIMSDYTLPYRYKCDATAKDVLESSERHAPFGARSTLHLARCRVRIPKDDMYGLDCRKGGEDERLIFPTGTYETWLWEPHIDFALKRGWIQEVLGGYAYHADMLMRGFAQDMYRERLEAKDPCRKTIIKLLMNSLYGKAAQKSVGVWEDEPATDKLDNTRDMLGVSAGRFQYIDDDGEHHMAFFNDTYYRFVEPTSVTHQNSCFSIASYITACGRYIMNKYFRVIEGLGGNVYYCDTDSLVTDVEMPSIYASRTELGKLKLEWSGKVEFHDGEPNVEFRAPKDYTIDFRSLTKGVRKGEARTGFDNTYRQFQFKRHSTLLLSPRKAAKEDFRTEAAGRYVEKRILSDNTKRQGTQAKDGFLLPIVLEE